MKTKGSKCLTWRQRLQIEALLKANVSKKKIAETLGVSLQTIYNELKRGRYMRLDTHLVEHDTYSPDKAQTKYEYNLTGKGPELKIACDYGLIEYIEKRVLEDELSPCAALGEMLCGNDFNLSSAVMLTLGTGVGGGIIIDGKIFSGSNSVAGELGHMVIKSGGEKCGCGRSGCWEAYASATAIIRETKRAIKENPDSLLAKNAKEEGEVNGKTAFDAAWAGCEVAKKVVDDYFTAIAEGLTNIVNIFQPQAIVIGGGVSRQGDKLLNPIKEHVYKYCYGSGLVDVAKISIAQLGNDAGIVGAAFLGK